MGECWLSWVMFDFYRGMNITIRSKSTIWGIIVCFDYFFGTQASMFWSHFFKVGQKHPLNLPLALGFITIGKNRLILSAVLKQIVFKQTQPWRH